MMTEMEITILVILGLVVATLRALPRIIWPHNYGNDVHFHFYYANLIYKNGHSVPDRIEQVLGGPNETTYPAFYHILLSYIPRRYWYFVDRYCSILFDLLVTVPAGFLIYHYSEATVFQTLVAVLLYLIAPALTFSGVGPRAYSLTPRNFAHLFTSLGLILLFLEVAVENSNFVFFGLAALSFNMVILASKFGLQFLIFVLPITGLFGGGWLPMASLALSIVLCMLFAKKLFIRQVKGQLLHIEWYYHCALGFVTHRDDWKTLWKHIQTFDIPNIARDLLIRNPILIAFSREITHFVPLLLFISLQDFGVNNTSLLLFSFVLASCVPWIVTSFRPFLILGEAERYLEFAFVAAWILTFIVLDGPTIDLLLYGYALFFFVFYAANILVIRQQANIARHKYTKEAVDFINKCGKVTILCLTNNETFHFIRCTKAKAVGWICNAIYRGAHKQFFDKFYIQYPTIEPNYVNEICKQYDVDYIVSNRSYIEAVKACHKELKLNPDEIVFANEFYMIYKCRPKNKKIW